MMASGQGSGYPKCSPDAERAAIMPIPIDISKYQEDFGATACPKPVCVGWAEAAAALATSNEQPAWPEFANDDDADLAW